MIKVVNKYKHNPTKDDYYIGRGSPLGNPFTSIQDRKTKAEYVCDSREESVANFEKWIENKILERDSIVIDTLNKLYLKAKKGNLNLVCFCAPKLCHGDVIKNKIEEKLSLCRTQKIFKY